VVPAARPSDRALLGTLGIDLEEVRRTTEQTFGFTALGEAIWQVSRRRAWRGGGVVWTPLCGPPFLAKRALQLAGERPRALGHDEVGPEHVLLGVLEDALEACCGHRQPRSCRRGGRRCGLQPLDQPARFSVEGPHRDEPTLGVVSQPLRRRLCGGEERLLRADVGVDAVQSKGEVGVEVDHATTTVGGSMRSTPWGVMSTVMGAPVAGQVASAWTGRPSARASRSMSTLQPSPDPIGRPPLCTR
jgi:hypothetical protein